MANAGDAGDGGVQSGRHGRAQHLYHAAHHHHDRRQVQADVVYDEDAARFGAGEGEVLLQQHQQQEEHHAQQEVVGMYRAEGGPGGKAVKFGELTIKHPTDHREDGVEKSRIHVAFHVFSPLFFSHIMPHSMLAVNKLRGNGHNKREPTGV